ncbi:MAG: asparagine synthase (glutamine-hydrolyzing) [Burkholderiales bacterium]|nr:asparagine synthase (glutamine-hydrolyzing) [Burkholderiales bacterium]
MCGIVGWLGPDIDPNIALRMRDVLQHRGPDDAGHWHDTEASVWLGHRRLSILDLSPTGHQPMHSASGRYVIVFNGEVFNFAELRTELEAGGCVFRGHSDTEVMLASIEKWGLREALARFVGMFAFALWDRETRSLTLVRDRLGIKPLYYATQGSRFAFASELHALAGIPWLDKEIDHDAVADYLRYLCVPAPRSILRGVRKLEPGTLLVWTEGIQRIERYWDIRDVARSGLAAPLQLSFRDAADELEVRLREVVGLRMRADVPYGAFLSGGVDSSLVVALMREQSSQPLHTFTIGFAGSAHDESAHARAVAQHLGTQHHEELLEADAVPALLGEVVTLHDEPFADGSSVPTYLLCRFARRHVTVALAGDGGDELFGGYPRYFWAKRIQRWRTRLGARGARAAAGALHAVPAAVWDGPVNWLSKCHYASASGLAARVHRFADYITFEPREADMKMIAAWADPGEVMVAPASPARDRYADWSGLDWAAQMMAVDQAHYLPDDILTKVDRMSMAVSMEVRVPMLDHRLVEWSWRVPAAFKLAEMGDRGKLLLREVLYRHVPKALIERPKIGFGMPMDQWLRGPLRAWAEDLLSAESIRRGGLLRPEAVQQVWQSHLAGKNRLPQLWTVLMLQQWLNRWQQLTGKAGQ